MLIWRLSTAPYANVFDGGYGLFNNGRWNSRGNRITYCATSPSLCLLEKLVHIEDPALLPPLKMVRYLVPDSLMVETTPLAQLPHDWIRNQSVTQDMGDEWLRAVASPLRTVPSAVVPLKDSPDLNILINHAHPDSADIKLLDVTDFAFDARLLA